MSLATTRRFRSSVGLLAAASAVAATVAVGGAVAASSDPGVAAPPEASGVTVGNLALPETRDSAAAAKKGIKLTGAVDERGKVTAAELRAFPQRTVKASYIMGVTRQDRTFTGPLLLDVLTDAGADLRDILNDELRYALVVRATDGYEAVLAYAELLPKYAGKKVLIALTEDGKRLAIPRIVVPGDNHGGRYVFDVAQIAVLRLTASLANGKLGSG